MLHNFLASFAHPEAVLIGAVLVLAGCSSGGGGSGVSSGSPGQELDKPGGGTFFVDPNRGGKASRVHLVEMFWARLVDIHGLDGQGQVVAEPSFEDFAVNENLQSDSLNYRLETNPITQKTRLVILRERGAPDAGFGTFDSLLRLSADGLPPILPKHDDGSTGDQYSFVARNAAIVLRFDDLLDDGQVAETNLSETIRVQAGYPPVTPFSSRLLFDPNHGAVVSGEFHSTRVLIDMTVSEAESTSPGVVRPVNNVGLPPSITITTDPNVTVRIPTVTDFGSGQFELLRGMSGSPLSQTNNGPMDLTISTRDVVRAFRSGNSADLNNGFLLDLSPPEIIGGWVLQVDRALVDPLGDPGFDFLLDVTFTTVCRGAPGVGDVVSIGETSLEVVEESAQPDVDGKVQGLRVRNLAGDPLDGNSVLVGNALFLSTFQPTDSVPSGCWLNFSPSPIILPTQGVATNSQVLVRFSEPMDPNSLSPFDTFYVVAGDANTEVTSKTLIVGSVVPSGDLKDFIFQPSQLLPHAGGSTETFHARVTDPTDLAGNSLAFGLPPVNFELDPAQTSVNSAGTVIRFNSTDELEPIGNPDLRGQLFFDFDRQVIRPRPVSLTSHPADRINPVVANMTPINRGVQTPLAALGSKLQALWRYCDLGWQVLDETKYNLDVYGLSWAPVGGSVINDFFEQFEIALAHSRRLPDETIDQFLLPRYPGSGVGSNFAANILTDPRTSQEVVHFRNSGYQVNSADLFLAGSGTIMLPYPLNRGSGPPRTYTWRDTAVLTTAAPGAVGIPLDIESGPPTSLENGHGYVADVGRVPSIGLPLLIEYRCFPSNTALGLNSLDISIAINSSPIPSFRAYSTGGINSAGIAVRRNPDTEGTARGGFNPSAQIPGTPTPRGDENAFYIGQLDVVTRISRVHSVWIDTGSASSDFHEPVVLPRSEDQPNGTAVILEYRGSDGFTLGNIDLELGETVDESLFPFDARRLNAYGEIFARFPQSNAELPAIHRLLGSSQFPGEIQFINGVRTWSDDIDSIDTARHVQIRITFVSNIETGLSPELSAIGIPHSAL